MAPPRPLHRSSEAPRAPVEDDEISDRILDAALNELRDVGMRGSSLDSVAEQLGIDRTTVSQRFESMDALARAVMLRETRRYLKGVGLAITADTVRSRVEEGFLAGVALRREQHILQALHDRDPRDAIALVMGPEAGLLLEYAIKITRKALRHAPDSSNYTAASLDAVATAMIRLSHSLSNAPPDLEMDDHYLRGITRNLLLPLLVPVHSATSGP
jgi:TetR/AcrR family transcriptional regulator, repressor for uid operon